MSAAKVIYGLVDEQGVVRRVGACKPERLRRRLVEHRSHEGRKWAVDIVQLEDPDNWQEAEDRWIRSYPPGQLDNQVPGGGGRGSGFKLSEDHRAKIAAAHRGMKKPWSREQGKKIGEAWRGKKRGPVSDAHSRALSEGQKKRFARERGEQ